MSKRKPYNNRAGYVASRRNEINRNWVVIYLAEAQQIDVEFKYAVVCEAHGTVVGATSIPLARPFLKVPSFCEPCMADSKVARE